MTATDEAFKALAIRLEPDLQERLIALAGQMNSLRALGGHDTYGNPTPPELTVGRVWESLHDVSRVLRELEARRQRRDRKRRIAAGAAAMALIVLCAGTGAVIDERTVSGGEVADAVTGPLALAAAGTDAEEDIVVSDCERASAAFSCTVVVAACDSEYMTLVAAALDAGQDHACVTRVEAGALADPDTDLVDLGSGEITEEETHEPVDVATTNTAFEQFSDVQAPLPISLTEPERESALKKLRRKFKEKFKTPKGKPLRTAPQKVELPGEPLDRLEALASPLLP